MVGVERLRQASIEVEGEQARPGPVVRPEHDGGVVAILSHQSVRQLHAQLLQRRRLGGEGSQRLGNFLGRGGMLPIGVEQPVGVQKQPIAALELEAPLGEGGLLV
mgnify:CR=1 FL=1